VGTGAWGSLVCATYGPPRGLELRLHAPPTRASASTRLRAPMEATVGALELRLHSPREAAVSAESSHDPSGRLRRRAGPA
jgi:hypothetical protein